MVDKQAIHILTINSGSSSLKFALFQMGKSETLRLSGSLERIGLAAGVFQVKDGAGKSLIEQHLPLPDHNAAQTRLREWLESEPIGRALNAVGHRLVHGGARYTRPHLLTPEVAASLQQLVPLAPIKPRLLGHWGTTPGQNFPGLRIRVVNVVDLMKLQPASEHPHGLSDQDFDSLFTRNKPIIFAFHGYPWLIHRLTYRRTNHQNLHVRGCKEEGTITTPFDMAVLNDLDRFHLVGDVIDRLPQLGPKADYVKQALRDKLIEHREYICQKGEDLPEIREWRWGRS